MPWKRRRRIGTLTDFFLIYFIFRIIGDDDADEQCQTDQRADKNEDMNENRVLLKHAERSL